MTTAIDYPFDQCCKEAEQFVRSGATVFQKWTCSHCGDRVTANTPNKFTTLGHHEDCGHITDIKSQGCNYMMIALIT